MRHKDMARQILPIDGAIRETDAEYAERITELAQKMYTIEEIAEIYHSVTGGWIADDHPKFLDELRQRIA